MVKLNHLRHPLRAARSAQHRLAAYWRVKQYTVAGERRLREDARYRLEHIADGPTAHFDDGVDDSALLRRICTAYTLAAEQQANAGKTYGPTAWWQGVQHRSLGPVQRALAAHDTESLRAMYGNFFRDPCSSGLVMQPLHTAKAAFSNRTRDLYRRFFLVDALDRLDYWKRRTGGRFVLRELAGPGIGNPFGVRLEDTLLQAGAAYQHYCAQRILDRLPPKNLSVMEIGGGYGGMAYYLLRDRPELTYLDFDVPESLALTAYYLMKSFPQRRFLLYGEGPLEPESTDRFDVILMPAFEIAMMPAKHIGFAFSSHTLSALTRAAKMEYLRQIARITRDFFLFIGHEHAGESLDHLLNTAHLSLSLEEKILSEWNNHRVAHASEVERLYRVL